MALSLALYSLHRRIREGRPPLAIEAIPRFVRETFGLSLVDATTPLMRLDDPAVRGALRRAADAEGVAIRTVAVGGEGDLTDPDPEERRRALLAHKAWFERVRELGAFAMRANTGGVGREGDPEAVARCADSFAQLAAWGREHGVKVMIENHGGVSADPDAILEIIRQVDSEYLGTLPDFGNFRPGIRYAGLEKLMPHAIAVHAKLFTFDADGNHVSFDLERCLEIVRRSGYTGPLSIEFEGPEDEVEGIRNSRALLERLGWG